MKKLVLAFAVASFLSACQVSDVPEDGDIFEVKDNVSTISDNWQVESATQQAEDYLYSIDTKVYEIVARRTTNKLLNYTAPIADRAERPTIYVADVQVMDQNLPEGFAYSRKITKDLLENAQAFMVVNDPSQADYFLDTEVETIELKDSTAPVINYTLILSDANEEVIQEWTETIRQVKNDDGSWW